MPFWYLCTRLKSPEAVDYLFTSLSVKQQLAVREVLQGASSARIAKTLGLSKSRTTRMLKHTAFKIGLMPSFEKKAHSVSIPIALLFAPLIERVPASRRTRSILLDMPVRQKQTLAAVMANKTSQEISEEIGITVYTVKKHLTELFTKTGASSRLELVVWYISHFR